MRATHVCARVLIDVGCSKVCRVVHDQRDFLECHTTDHLTKDRSMHLEGKTNGDARGREIATCATVGAEIQTCIRRLVRAWPLEPTSGRGAVSPRSPGSHGGSQWAIPKMRVYWNQAKKCKVRAPEVGVVHLGEVPPRRGPSGPENVYLVCVAPRARRSSTWSAGRGVN